MEERRLKWGWNELAERKVNPILQFLAYFWGPMPCMIWLAVIVEFIKGALGAFRRARARARRRRRPPPFSSPPSPPHVSSRQATPRPGPILSC